MKRRKKATPLEPPAVERTKDVPSLSADLQQKRRGVPFAEPARPGEPLDRLRTVMVEHSEAIAEIAARGEVSVVVCEPSQSWQMGLKQHGWSGETVFPMGKRMQLAMSTSDHTTERWIVEGRPNTTRIFAVLQEASLLLNLTAEGYSVEPGSTDDEGSH